MDKSWMRKPIGSKEFKLGVQEFILYASEKGLKGNKMYCPCRKCFNMQLLKPEDAHIHLLRYGILSNYSLWTFHGEHDPFFDENSPACLYGNDNISFGGSSSEHHKSSCGPSYGHVGQIDMRGLLDDAINFESRASNSKSDKTLNEMNDNDDNVENTFDLEYGQTKDNNDVPSIHGDNISCQLHTENYDVELYPGCKKFSKLSFILRLYHIKCLSGWSAKSLNMLFELLNEAFPEGASIPSTYYEAKKLIRELGLGYQKIHACPNDCMLFHGDDLKNLDKCKVCDASRWLDLEHENSNDHKEDVKIKRRPSKVLRYFPLKPRLRRLFRSSKTAFSMRWHAEGRIKDGKIRHVADGLAWRSFDARYPDFSSECRNLRFALSSDGFNPYRSMSTTYSTWPVVLVIYNMEPWNCMKQSSILLSMIIPGKKGPGNDIDIYLQPLVHELKELWEGIDAFDAHTGQNFQLRGALLWTINDFPAFGNLSGWSTKGQFACPCCMEDTHSQWLTHGGKFCYMGARRWLEPYHPFRLQKEQFDGTQELHSAPTTKSGVEIELQLRDLKFSYGKASATCKKRQRDMVMQANTQVTSQHCLFENNDLVGNNYVEDQLMNSLHNSNKHLWKKRSIFFVLPYWKYNILRHCLDVMHIEKNVFDNVIETLLDIPGKSKDNLKARLDLQKMGRRKDLHPVVGNDKLYLPAACFTMDIKEKNQFLSVLKNLKLPDGYASNISRCVNLKERKLVNLKSHDSHILMQDILPIALRASMSKPVVAVISELSNFFKSLCAKTIDTMELDHLQSQIVLTLCKMEKIFPPSFFTIMVHLMIHLVDEVKLGGPVVYRWMYPIERFLCRLKSHVRNKAYPEGSIAEGYIADECLTFISRYFVDVETKFNREPRNNEKGENLVGYLFESGGRVLGKASIMVLDEKSLVQAHRYVLLHYEKIDLLRSEFLIEKRKAYHPKEVSNSLEQQWLLKCFASWLSTKVSNSESVQYPDEIVTIARGPYNVVRSFNSFIINGFRFHTKFIERMRTTQNSGVMVQVAEKPYYGVVTDIYELNYSGKLKVVLFRCNWVDVSYKGLKTKDGSVLVNFSRLIHTGQHLYDDPFIFSSQARQVFYVQDPKENEWYHVVITKPRDLFDIGSPHDNDEDHAMYV